jgi:hypothetical protein
VLRADVDCSVCYRRECPRRCIDAIRVDAVSTALESLYIRTPSNMARKSMDEH